MWRTRCGRIVDGRRCAAGVYYCSNYRAAMSTAIVALVRTYHLAARRVVLHRLVFRRGRKSSMKFRFARRESG